MTSEVMVLARRADEPCPMTTTPTTRTSSTTTARDHSAGLVHPLASPFLLADGAVTGLNALAYVVAAGWLADWFGAPEPLVRALGVFLLLVSAGVVLLATRRPIPRRGVAALASLNIAWVVASVVYATTAQLTVLGTVWTVLQAVVVSAFAAAQVWLARKG
jgi:hypothetical protein